MTVRSYALFEAEVEDELVNTNLHKVQLVYGVCLKEVLRGERVMVTNWRVLQQIFINLSSLEIGDLRFVMQYLD